MGDFDEIIKRNRRIESFVASQMDKPWNEWPDVRYLARRYKCCQGDIVDVVDSSENLDLIVGFKTASGHGEFERLGDYKVEWFE